MRIIPNFKWLIWMQKFGDRLRIIESLNSLFFPNTWGYLFSLVNLLNVRKTKKASVIQALDFTGSGIDLPLLCKVWIRFSFKESVCWWTMFETLLWQVSITVKPPKKSKKVIPKEVENLVSMLFGCLMFRRISDWISSLLVTYLFWISWDYVM